MPSRKNNKKRRKRRSLKRQKGGLKVMGFELNPYTRFFGKDTQDLDKTNVAASPASPASPDSNVIDLTSPSQSPSEAPTESPSESPSETPSETPCPTCDACKKGECTLGVDSAAAGLLSDAQKTVTEKLKEGKKAVENLAHEGKKKMSDGLMDASLAARPSGGVSTSSVLPNLQGGRRKRRRKKTRRRRKKSRGKKKRKTRRKRKSSKRRRR